MGREPIHERKLVYRGLLSRTVRRQPVVCCISPPFGRLSTTLGKVTHVLLTRAPLYRGRSPFSCDLHVLGAPLTFALSQDQTLQLFLARSENLDLITVSITWPLLPFVARSWILLRDPLPTSSPVTVRISRGASCAGTGVETAILADCVSFFCDLVFKDRGELRPRRSGIAVPSTAPSEGALGLGTFRLALDPSGFPREGESRMRGQPRQPFVALSGFAAATFRCVSLAPLRGRRRLRALRTSVKELPPCSTVAEAAAYRAPRSGRKRSIRSAQRCQAALEFQCFRDDVGLATFELLPIRRTRLRGMVRPDPRP